MARRPDIGEAQNYWVEALPEEPEPVKKRVLTPGKERTTRAKRPRSKRGTTREGKALMKPTLTHSETVVELESKKAMLIAGITEEKIAKASLPQIGVALGIVFDKIQILKGEPTQILRREDRPALDRLVRDLVEVSKARGIILEGEFTSVEDQSGE